MSTACDLLWRIRRILIVDDEDDIREVAQVSLELVGGYEVLTASSGRDGLERARGGQPDAILLDVMMPDMDGPATLVELRADPATRDIPVVFLTAKTQTAERQQLGNWAQPACSPSRSTP